MASPNFGQAIDINALKAQVDTEIAARLLEEADAARHIQRRGFRIGKLRLLVSLDAASEVSEIPPLFRLPGAPTGIVGLVNRYGRVMPVVDLYLLLGIEQGHTTGSWLLTCGRGDAAIGLIIDSLPERKRFVGDNEVSLKEVARPIAAHARAAYREGADIWIDVDFDALFTAVFQVDLASD